MQRATFSPIAAPAGRTRSPGLFLACLRQDNANRLKTVTVAGTVRGTYTYNGFEQLISRVITNSGTANGTVNSVHDLWGNVIAELDATGATVREYIWLPEAEIAPTRQSRAQVDIPLAVVDAVNTTPVILNVHADHLARPVKMTNSAKASVWDVIYTPWGAPHTLTGAQTLNERFPGQWFQLESGLHYNWHRHYDPSLGRYTQPDPLGFVDGPSVYGYVHNAALTGTDPEGLMGRGGGPGQPRPSYPNGNYTPSFTPQDQVCTYSGSVGDFANSSPRILSCCKQHDDCYTKYRCNESSWQNHQRPPPMCPSRNLGPRYACDQCNQDLKKCILETPFSAPPPQTIELYGP